MTVAGETVDVIPLSSLPADPASCADLRDPGVTAALLLPSTEADIRIHPISAGGVASPFALAISALAFLTAVRGLPITELSCAVGEEIIESVKDYDDGKIGVILSKYKLLSSNSHKYACGVSIRYHLLEDGIRSFVLTECADAACFSGELLRALPQAAGDASAIPLAWSHRGGAVGIYSPTHLPPLALAHPVASLLAVRSPTVLPITVCCPAGVLVADETAEGIVLSVSAPSVATFRSPLCP